MITKILHIFIYIIIIVYNADRNLHLGDINKASGESWQVLNEEEKDIYIKKAAEEASLCSGVDLRQILKQLSKLVCQIYCTWYLNRYGSKPLIKYRLQL